LFTTVAAQGELQQLAQVYARQMSTQIWSTSRKSQKKLTKLCQRRSAKRKS